MDEENTLQESPFACDMSAFAPSERKQHLAAIEEVFGAVQEIRELHEGYAFRLPGEDAWLAKAANFMAKERLEPEGGALWLSLTGREGVKPFIGAEIGHALDAAVARAAGLS